VGVQIGSVERNFINAYTLVFSTCTNMLKGKTDNLNRYLNAS